MEALVKEEEDEAPASLAFGTESKMKRKTTKLGEVIPVRRLHRRTWRLETFAVLNHRCESLLEYLSRETRRKYGKKCTWVVVDVVFVSESRRKERR